MVIVELDCTCNHAKYLYHFINSMIPFCIPIQIDLYMASDRKPYTTLPHYHIIIVSNLSTWK